MLWVTMTIVVAARSQSREQLEVEALAGQRVERAERLVEEEHLGLEGQRPGERGPLAHPAGQLGRAGPRPPAASSPTSSMSSAEARGAPLLRASRRAPADT